MSGYPSPEELEGADWVPLVRNLRPSATPPTPTTSTTRGSGRMCACRIYPDGGVARFRVHGEIVPDPRFLAARSTLLRWRTAVCWLPALTRFTHRPQNLILPGRAQIMGHGWENARRRGDGNDFAIYRLAGEGTVEHVELDTSYFVGNAPGMVKLSGCMHDRPSSGRRRRMVRPGREDSVTTRHPTSLRRLHRTPDHARAPRRLPRRRVGQATSLGQPHRRRSRSSPSPLERLTAPSVELCNGARATPWRSSLSRPRRSRSW